MKDLEDLLPRRSNMPDLDEHAGQKKFYFAAMISADNIWLFFLK